MGLNAKLTILIALTLIVPPSTLALTIETCSSNGNDWECEEGKICTCEILGDCTGGNLLVYKESIDNLLCAPPIVGGIVEIDWDYCENPEGTVKIIADCNEGQSEEELISIISVGTTTTTTLPEETTTVEIIKRECPYECCVDEPYYYDKYCDVGFECVDNFCVSTEEKKFEEEEGGIGGKILVVFILIVIVVIFVLMFRRRASITYEELYKKWSRR